MTLDIDLTAAKFHDENAAREWFEASRWPHGVICVHCGSDRPRRMSKRANAKRSGRVGLFHCPACRGQFTVRTGHVMESSHIPLTKWALAFHLMASSKKGVSAKQIQRTLNIAYNSAWFMMHRIREAMTETDPAPLGGEGMVVEADEAYHGKTEIPIPSASRKGRPYLKRETAKQKRPIAVLVERRGKARAEHMKHVTGDNIGEFLKCNADTRAASA